MNNVNYHNNALVEDSSNIRRMLILDEDLVYHTGDDNFDINEIQSTIRDYGMTISGMTLNGNGRRMPVIIGTKTQMSILLQSEFGYNYDFDDEVESLQ